MSESLFYSLTDEDYRRLWMVATPKQINLEFGSERAKSARSIYRIYEKYRISGITEHRKDLMAQLQRKAGPTVSEAWLRHRLRREEEEERLKAFAEVWEKIHEYEEHFNALD